jgi:hypothetical protein
MVFSAHGGGFYPGETGKSTIVYWLMVLVIWGFIEASALGFVGGLDSPFNKLVFDKHRDTIIYGFVLLAVLYFVGWELLLAP